MTRRFVYDLLERGGRPRRPIPAPSAGSGSPEDDPPEARSSPQALTVTQAVRAIRRQLEGAFADLHVEGEVSNLSRPRSGHWYFTLKDDRCQLPAVMFSGDNRRVPFELEEGAAVVARGGVSFYEGGGRTQLIVRQLEPAGVGARALALRQRAEKLAREGLFNADRKRPLPRVPRRLGVVTSPTGAALRDILQISRRRFPRLPVVISPTRVQGSGADREIVDALERLDRSGLADLIIVGRGGGSLEDLEAFSSEAVVRAVAACRTPVVSAVGHEIDSALCDLAADARAPTPSAAAELAVPERAGLDQALTAPLVRMTDRLHRRLDRERLRLRDLRGAISDPKMLVLSRRQDIDQYLRRGERALEDQLERSHRRVERARVALDHHSPTRRATRARAALEVQRLRLANAMQRRSQVIRHRMEAAVAALDALSPLAVLGRGYAICLHQGQAVRDAADLSRGDRLAIRLFRGRLSAEVTASDPDDTE